MRLQLKSVQHLYSIKQNKVSGEADVRNLQYTIEERIAEYSELVRNPQYRGLDISHHIYTDGHKKGLYSTTKNNLPAIINTSLTENTAILGDKNIKYYIPLYCFDIDITLEKNKIYTPTELDYLKEGVAEIKEIFIKNQNVSCVHTSASKLGLTGLIKIGDKILDIKNDNININELKIEHAQRILTFNYEMLHNNNDELDKICKKYGFHFDTSVKDLIRRRYLTNDETLHLKTAQTFTAKNDDLVLVNSHRDLNGDWVKEIVKQSQQKLKHNTLVSSSYKKNNTYKKNTNKKGVIDYDLSNLNKVNKKALELLEKDFYVEDNTIYNIDTTRGLKKKGSLCLLDGTLMFKMFSANNLQGYDFNNNELYFPKDIFKKNDLDYYDFINGNLSKKHKSVERLVLNTTPKKVAKKVIVDDTFLDINFGKETLLTGKKYITEDNDGKCNSEVVKRILKAYKRVSLESTTGTGKSRLISKLNPSKRIIVASPVTSIQQEQALSLNANEFGIEYKVFNSVLKNINSAHEENHILCCHASMNRILESIKKDGNLHELTLIVDEYHALLTTMDSDELDKFNKFIFEHNINILYISATVDESFNEVFKIQHNIRFSQDEVKNEDITFYVETEYYQEGKIKKKDYRLAFLKQYLAVNCKQGRTIFVAIENIEEMNFLHDSIGGNYKKLLFNSQVDNKESITQEITQKEIDYDIIFMTSIVEAGNNIIKEDTRLLVMTPLSGYHQNFLNDNHFNAIRNTQLKGRLRNSSHIDFYIDYEIIAKKLEYTDFSDFKSKNYYDDLVSEKFLDYTKLVEGVNKFITTDSDGDKYFSETEYLKYYIDLKHSSKSIENIAVDLGGVIKKASDIITTIDIAEPKSNLEAKTFMSKLRDYVKTDLYTVVTWGVQKHFVKKELQQSILKSDVKTVDYSRVKRGVINQQIEKWLSENVEYIFQSKTVRNFKKIVDEEITYKNAIDFYNSCDTKNKLNSTRLDAIDEIKGVKKKLAIQRILDFKILVEHKKFLKDQTAYLNEIKLASTLQKKEMLNKAERLFAIESHNFKTDITNYVKSKSKFVYVLNKDLVDIYKARFKKANFSDFIKLLNIHFNIDYKGSKFENFKIKEIKKKSDRGLFYIDFKNK